MLIFFEFASLRTISHLTRCTPAALQWESARKTPKTPAESSRLADGTVAHQLLISKLQRGPVCIYNRNKIIVKATLKVKQDRLTSAGTRITRAEFGKCTRRNKDRRSLQRGDPSRIPRH